MDERVDRVPATGIQGAIPRALREPANCQALVQGGGEGLGMYDVTFGTMENGYIAHVGCKKFCFADKAALMEAISIYLDNPKAAAKRYLRDNGKMYGIE